MTELPLSTRRWGRNCYLVRSEVPAKVEWYLCDFEDPQFPRGICTCVHFQVRIEAPIRRGDIPEGWDCKHLRHVMALLDGFRQLAEMNGTEIEPAACIPWAKENPATLSDGGAW